MADGYALLSTPGWMTLLAILESTGESWPRPLKRRSEGDEEPSERLLKRIGDVTIR
jgi:nuclear protein localization family protein 4